MTTGEESFPLRGQHSSVLFNGITSLGNCYGKKRFQDKLDQLNKYLYFKDIFHNSNL